MKPENTYMNILFCMANNISHGMFIFTRTHTHIISAFSPSALDKKKIVAGLFTQGTKFTYFYFWSHKI